MGSDFIDLIREAIYKLLVYFPARVSFIIIFVLCGVFIWMGIILLDDNNRRKIIKYVFQNIWFYIFFVVLTGIAIFISTPVPVKYFGVFSDKYVHGSKEKIIAQPWSETSCNSNNLKLIKSDGADYISLSYGEAKYGFGFQYPQLLPKNLSGFRKGYLHFSIRYDLRSISQLRIGIQSFGKRNAWIPIDLNNEIKQIKGGWCIYKISLLRFKEVNQNIDFSRITQFLMVETTGESKGKIDFDEVFWKNRDSAGGGDKP